MRIIFSRLYWFLIFTLIIFGFALLWMLGTQPGGHWLMGKLLERSPENLTITNYSGTLIRGFSAEKLEFKNKGIHLVIDGLNGDYSIFSLLDKKLNINQLEAKKVTVVITPKKKDPDKQPALPVFSSPLPIAINHLMIAQLELKVKDKSYLLNQVSTQLRMLKDQLNLDNLTTKFKSANVDTDIMLKFSAPFPISVQGTYEIPKIFTASNILIDGELNQYNLSLKAVSNLKNIPSFTGDMEATGNFYGLDILKVDLNILEGNVTGNGKLSWKNGLKTHIKFSGDKIKPEGFNKNFPGLLSVKGQYAFEQHKTSINFHTKGNVRNYPIDLISEISIEDKTVNVHTAKARIGTNDLDLSGMIYPGLIGVLDIKMKAPDLHALHPDFKGQANLSGKMNGDLRQPVFDIELSGDQFQYKNFRSEKYHADFSPGTFRDHYFFDVTANNITTGATQFKSIRLNGTFSERTQNATITIFDSKFFDQLSGKVSGAYDKKTATWKGKINRLDISERHLSTYKLKSPAPILLSKNIQSISSFCLGHNKERLCVNGSIALQDSSKIDISLTDFPVQRLKHWIPDSGVLKEIINGNATITGSHGQWMASTDIGFGLSNKLISKLTFDQPTQNIKGKININFSKMEWINLFTDDIISPQGKLSINLDISGKLSRPSVLGEITLNEGFARIPGLGTEFSDIKLDAHFDSNKQVTLAAKLKSGEGELGLKGTVDLNKFPFWSARITTSGEHFEAVNIPVAKVSISPRLIILANTQGIDITGTLVIPDANLSLGDLSSMASYPSADEIIIGEEKERKKESLPFNANIEVELGDNVNISGFGLTSRLTGALTIIQKNGKPVEADGSIQLVDGEYKAYGQKLQIERGDIYFNGPIKAPGLNMRATRKIESEDVIAGLKVSGTLKQPKSEVFSIPPLPETDALAYLLTGRPLNGLGEGDSSMLLNAAARLGLKSGAGSIDKLRRKAGLDTFAIQAGQDISDSTLILGKFLTPDLYIQYVTKLFTESETFSLRYRLSQKLHLEAESDQKNQSMDLIYQYER